jgi:hypothetical protein
MKPSVDRIVWYRKLNDDQQPMAAIITYVCNDACVNLAVFDEYGGTMGKQMVKLIGENELPPLGGGYAQWPVITGWS